MRLILHLDMDAFYAAIEQRDHPALLGKPVIVGSPPTQRGVVCAASYEARRFGVRSAISSSSAARLCPNGVFVQPRMSHYRDESKRIMDIVAGTGGIIEQMSIDEAYVDLTAVFPALVEAAIDPDEALAGCLPTALDLKAAIRKQRGLTASIGVASNKFLAKLGSDFKKPDGLTLVPERDKVKFLRPLPVRVIHGVGPVTEQELAAVGVHNVGELQDFPGNLKTIVGSFGDKLRRLAFGDDDRPVDPGEVIKSISSEETFLHDTADRPLLRRCLREQADEISGKLKRKGLGASTVQVKVRYSDFTTVTRQITVEESLVEPADLYRLGCYLLGRDRLVTRPLRLLGLGVSGLGEPLRRQLLLL